MNGFSLAVTLGLTCMQMAADIATGIDPFTKEQVYIARQLKGRELQWALMQFFKPENYFTAREALLQTART